MKKVQKALIVLSAFVVGALYFNGCTQSLTSDEQTVEENYSAEEVENARCIFSDTNRIGHGQESYHLQEKRDNFRKDKKSCK